jgi:CHAD domain-containing protein
MSRMAYRLENGETMATGIRRIVGQQIDAALEGLTRDEGPEVVHDVRKRLKKSRSALRLVRDDLGNGVRRRENRVLRDAGRRLSGVRDAQVLVETLDALGTDHSVSPATAQGLRLKLTERRARIEAEAGHEGAAQETRAELAALRERIQDWPLRDDGFDSVKKGLRRIHSRGAKAMRAALRNGDDESWHAWRKRVKDLWYATRILEPLSPQLKGMVADAEELSDILGMHNDVSVLAAMIDDHEEAIGVEAAQSLRAALAERRDELRRKSVPPGTRLYGESSKALADRLAQYWRARGAERATDARWVDAETAAEVRALIDSRAAATGSERERLSAALRQRGFGITALAEQLGRPARGFSVAEWDALVERGAIRVGAPPTPELLAR